MQKLKFMEIAYKEAQKAFLEGEVPIGAVIVKDGKVVAKAHNKREKSQVATHHAEILAIDKACKKLKSWRLDECEIFVTIEPCSMCAGAICNARLKKLYFGAKEEKSGAVVSKFQLLEDNGLNWATEFEGGVLEDKCASLIKDFFKKRRLGLK